MKSSFLPKNDILKKIIERNKNILPVTFLYIEKFSEIKKKKLEKTDFLISNNHQTIKYLPRTFYHNIY